MTNVAYTGPTPDVPRYAHPGDAGADLTAYEACEVPAYGRARVRTGLHIALPPNTVGYVNSRSGLAKNHGLRVFHAPGVIDSGYRGEIIVDIENTGPIRYDIAAGAKIAQLVVHEFIRVNFYREEDLPESLRGHNGFGSTDAEAVHAGG